MKDWLTKKPSGPPQVARKLPSQRADGSLPSLPRPTQQTPPAALPNATVIYGIGASLLFVAAFFLLVSGNWFPALAVCALGACLVGFALHLLKNQS